MLNIGRAIGAPETSVLCACAKMHQISFSAVRDCLEGLFSARVSSDVLIMQIIPSHEGYHYVFFIVDHATEMCCVLRQRCIGSFISLV